MQENIGIGSGSVILIFNGTYFTLGSGSFGSNSSSDLSSSKLSESLSSLIDDISSRDLSFGNSPEILASPSSIFSISMRYITWCIDKIREQSSSSLAIEGEPPQNHRKKKCCYDHYYLCKYMC